MITELVIRSCCASCIVSVHSLPWVSSALKEIHNSVLGIWFGAHIFNRIFRHERESPGPLLVIRH